MISAAHYVNAVTALSLIVSERTNYAFSLITMEEMYSPANNQLPLVKTLARRSTQ